MVCWRCVPHSSGVRWFAKRSAFGHLFCSLQFFTSLGDSKGTVAWSSVTNGNCILRGRYQIAQAHKLSLNDRCYLEEAWVFEHLVSSWWYYSGKLWKVWEIETWERKCVAGPHWLLMLCLLTTDTMCPVVFTLHVPYLPQQGGLHPVGDRIQSLLQVALARHFCYSNT